MSRRIRRMVSGALICTFSPAISLAQPAPPTAALPAEPATTPAPVAPEPARTAPPVAPPPESVPAAATSPTPGSAAAPAGYAQRSPDAGYYEPPVPVNPPPPPQKPRAGFEFPAISLRLDPFNWLLDGRLGFELESAVLSFMSVELVPMFVVSKKPPFVSQEFDHEVTQHSNGVGALSGASLGVGFWFAGKPLRGNVFRVILTNYGMTYRTYDSDGNTFDEVSHTERHLYAYLGSHSVFGKIFTIAGGVGLGVELNRQQRCYDAEGNATKDCGELNLQREGLVRGGQTIYREPWDLNSFSYPIEIMGRISLGVTFF